MRLPTFFGSAQEMGTSRGARNKVGRACARLVPYVGLGCWQLSLELCRCIF